MPIEAYIAMGSNLGDRCANIQGGLDAINGLESTTLLRCSTIIETEPIGPGEQSQYLNGVCLIETDLEPRMLLESLLEIEALFGRDRASEQRWGARTLDLDVLIFGDREIDEPGLTIPHPRLHQRLFVLEPLCELAPRLMIPGYEKTPQAMLGVLGET
jgi:2-amino-4-hydroxy-6-hydroxymethyldihydropteridine diphosphokinase